MHMALYFILFLMHCLIMQSWLCLNQLSLCIGILNAEITGVCSHNRSILPTDGKRNEMVRDSRTYYVKNMSFGRSLLKFRPSLDMPQLQGLKRIYWKCAVLSLMTLFCPVLFYNYRHVLRYSVHHCICSVLFSPAILLTLSFVSAGIGSRSLHMLDAFLLPLRPFAKSLLEAEVGLSETLLFAFSTNVQGIKGIPHNVIAIFVFIIIIDY